MRRRPQAKALGLVIGSGDTEYRDFQEARAEIGEFLDRVYNQNRLHSALGYLPTAEFENGAA